MRQRNKDFSLVLGVGWRGYVCAFLWLIACTHSSHAQGIWGEFRNDPQNTGTSVYTGPLEPGNSWSFTTGGSIVGSAAISHVGTSFIGSTDGILYVLSIDGEELWTFDTGSSIRSSSAIDDEFGQVIFGAEDGKVYAVDAFGTTEGVLNWSFQTGGGVRSSPTIGDLGFLYIGSNDGKIYALSEASGGLGWEFQTGGIVYSSPALYSDGLGLDEVYVGSFDGLIYAIDQLTGIESWRFPTGGPIYSSPSVASDGTVYVGSDDGFFYAIKGGITSWLTETLNGDGIRSSPAFSPNETTVYVGAEDGRLYAFDMVTGAIKWTFDTGGVVFSSPAVSADGTIYVGSASGNLFSIAPDGSENWAYSLGSGLSSSPSISTEPSPGSQGQKSSAGDNTIVIGGEDGVLYAVGPRNPLVLQRILPVEEQTLDLEQVTRYTIVVADTSGIPIAGAFVDVGDSLQGKKESVGPTDQAGGITYDTTVLPGTGSGLFPLTFTATHDAFDDSDPVVREVRVIRLRLIVSDVVPIGRPTLDNGQSVLYTISVTDRLGQPLTGARVDVDNEMLGGRIEAGLTDEGGQVQYEATVPAALVDGIYNLSFTAHRDNIDRSDPVVRQIEVREPAPGLDVSPTSVSFEDTIVGETRFQRVTLKNTGDADLNVSAFTIEGTDAASFEISLGKPPLLISSGSEEFIEIAFQPSTLGIKTASLEITSDGGDRKVPLSGTGLAPVLDADPTTLDFEQVDVGAERTLSATLTNTGNADLSIISTQLLGDDPSSFTIVSGGGSGILEPGRSRVLDIAFRPQEGGGKSALLAINSNAGQQDIALQGVGGTAQVNIEPDPVAFGPTVVGSTTLSQLSIQNTGDVNIVVNSITLEGASALSIVSGGESGTISPSQSRVVELACAPLQSGSLAGTLVLDSNAPEASVAVVCEGTVPLLSPPVVVDSPVLGQGMTVEVAIPNGFVPTSSQLFHRDSGELAFQSIDMIESEGLLRGVVPASSVTERGIDFYVATTNGTISISYPASEPDDDPVHQRVQVSELPAQGAFEAEAYRMISVPLDLQNKSILDVFGEAYGDVDPSEWRLAQWQAEIGQNVEFPELTKQVSPGTAFWLVTASGEGLSVRGGTSVDASSAVEVSIPRGWSQIANPFAFPVAWSSVEVQGTVQPPVAYRSGGYEYEQSVLQPWAGYFVFNEGEGPALLRFQPFALGSSTMQEEQVSLADVSEYAVQLETTIPTLELRDDQIFLGLISEEHGQHAMNLTKAPPAMGAFVSMGIVEEETAYVRQLKELSQGGQSWDLALTMSKDLIEQETTVQIVLSELQARPAGLNLYLQDLDEGRTLALHGKTAELTVLPGHEVRRLRLIAGSASFAESHSEDIPLQTYQSELDQNYPNPFNPSTIIGYSLGKRSHVLLEVYNVLGQKIRVLTSGQRNAGRYEVVWDGLDATGQEVGSGIYMYRLQAGAFSEVRTMLLLR